MRWLILAAPLVATLSATPAVAGECWLASLYQLSFVPRSFANDSNSMALPDDTISIRFRPELGLGPSHAFADPSAQTFAIDGALTVRRGFRIGAGTGICRQSSGESDNAFAIGLSGAAQLIGAARSRFDVTAQVGVSRYSADGFTTLAVPLIMGASMDVSDNTIAYAGPMLRYTRLSSDEPGLTTSQSDTNFGAVAGMQWISTRSFGINASIAALRQKDEGYQYCDGEICYGEGSTTEWTAVASVRVTYQPGSRRPRR